MADNNYLHLVVATFVESPGNTAEKAGSFPVPPLILNIYGYFFTNSLPQQENVQGFAVARQRLTSQEEFSLNITVFLLPDHRNCRITVIRFLAKKLLDTCVIHSNNFYW